MMLNADKLPQGGPQLSEVDIRRIVREEIETWWQGVQLDLKRHMEGHQ